MCYKETAGHQTTEEGIESLSQEVGRIMGFNSYNSFNGYNNSMGYNSFNTMDYNSFGSGGGGNGYSGFSYDYGSSRNAFNNNNDMSRTNNNYSDGQSSHNPELYPYLQQIRRQRRRHPATVQTPGVVVAQNVDIEPLVPHTERLFSEQKVGQEGGGRREDGYRFEIRHELSGEVPDQNRRLEGDMSRGKSWRIQDGDMQSSNLKNR